ncbi:c-type cytochrome [Candidatus Nitrospira allomarina]|uniref:Cytochrome c n=1 Tax=Candidatus Nitrospira allomarina TaxID=3020900 RepID=A0AA96G8A0_9BACT|nr:cytochrome c [Candidatus Nitrospira allomarina]WNM56582.1 cytochrome c [Candidatus Nitrospira allomarina]
MMMLNNFGLNRSFRILGWITLAGLFLWGCSEDMEEQPSFSYQEAPRVHSPPESSPNMTPFSLTTSPREQTKESTDGARLFAINCAHCHGEQGMGDGPVAGYLPDLPPNLHASAVQQKPDEMLYTIVTHGENVMPAFEPFLSQEERWALVAFLRTFSDHAPSASLLIQNPNSPG